MTKEQTELLNLFIGKEVGQDYDRSCCEAEKYATPKRLSEYISHYIDTLSLPQPKTCLALAVGTGLEAEQLKIKFNPLHITGVDLSLDMLNRAVKMQRIDHSINGNITSQTPGIQDQTMDMVVCCGGTEFNPGKLKAIADEMVRTLKPKGLLAITVRPPHQKYARQGYAYYTQEDVINIFASEKFLGHDSHHSFSMLSKLSPDTNEPIHVKYNTLFFQAS